MIIDKITARVPGTRVEEGGTLPTLVVEAGEYRALARFLREDEETRCDYLACMTGVDEGRSLEVVLLLESTALGHRLLVRTGTSDRDNPLLPTVSDLWEAANLNEREIYDYLGIRFTGHPDTRRLFLRNDWVGYPLRKDYDAANPPLLESDETPDSTRVYREDGTWEERPLFEEGEYVVNIGPQHPATHGVLRFRVALEGEIVKKADVHCGYIHRGIEKMCESLTYPQMLPLADRLDYLSAHQHRHALCACIEEALQLEVPARVQYIRTIMDELNRLSSHLLFWSTLCMDLGALTAFFYGFRDREKVLDIMEETTGGRLIQHYNVIGGVTEDIHPNFTRRVKEFIKYLPPMLKEYDQLFTGNVIARERMIGVGVLSRADAISYGVTGPAGRASGWACDVRKRRPYGVYDRVDFKEIVHEEGDSYHRYLARVEEIVESLRILEQLVDNIPPGDFAVKTRPVIKLPEGRYFKSVEGSRGEFGVYIESRGDKSPYRLKFRSTSFPLVSVVPRLVQGSKIADLITIGGTLDYIVPDVDR